MLAEGTVVATIAVKDINVSKKFYGDTLGLKQIQEDPAGVVYQSGNSKILVYPSEFAGTNKATYAGWSVTDVEGVAAELKEKGIAFEKFDLPGAKWEGDIAVFGSLKAAWFKDPDGNILSFGNM